MASLFAELRRRNVWLLAALAHGDEQEALRRLSAEAESEFVDGSSTLRAMVMANVWGAPVLEEPQFAELRGRLGLRN